MSRPSTYHRFTRTTRRRRLLLALLAIPFLIGCNALAQSASAGPPTGILCLNAAGTRVVVKIRPGNCTAFGPGGAFAGGVSLTGLRWSHWGSATAAATGVERGFHLPPEHIAVTVRAYRRRAGCDGGRRYTRLRATSGNGTTTVRLPTCPGPA